MHAWFGVVVNVEVELQNWTKHISQYIHGIFPTERKIVAIKFQPVAILTSLQTFMSLFRKDVQDDVIAHGL